jgi:hypothetical protein
VVLPCLRFLALGLHVVLQLLLVRRDPLLRLGLSLLGRLLVQEFRKGLGGLAVQASTLAVLDLRGLGAGHMQSSFLMSGADTALVLALSCGTTLALTVAASRMRHRDVDVGCLPLVSGLCVGLCEHLVEILC